VISQAPEDAAGVSFRARLTSYPTGYFWYDDFSVEQINIVQGIAPDVSTDDASGVSSKSVTLNGIVNPNGLETEVYFEYGTTTEYGNRIYPQQNPTSGSFAQNVSVKVFNLYPASYHYRFVAQNQMGTIYGADKSFTISSGIPTAITNPAVNVSEISAVLVGTINPNGSSTTVTFEYGLTDSYGYSVPADQSPVNGITDVSVSVNLEGLEPYKTYHFRVKANNDNGTSVGEDNTFVTSRWAEIILPYEFHSVFCARNVQIHGIAVDKYDRIWISEWGSNGNGIIIFDASGNEITSIDSLKVKISADSDSVITLENGRGMKVDQNGDIIYAQRSLTRIDVDSLKSTDYLQLDATLLKPGIDELGNIYAGNVVGINPISVIEPNNFEVIQEIYLDPMYYDYSRGMDVSLDGKTIIVGTLDPDPHPLYIYKTENYIDYAIADSVFISNDGDTIFTTQSVTVDRKSDDTFWISQDNSYEPEGDSQLENALIMLDIEEHEYGYIYMPEPRTDLNGPRGCAFSNDDNTLYVASWSAQKVFKYVKIDVPLVTTNQATNITQNSAVLNAAVNANGSSTSVIFEYGTTTSYGQSIIADQSPVDGTSDIVVSANIQGLESNTLYHFRARATNNAGTSDGRDQIFTTLSNKPTALTGEATNLTATGSTLNGIVNPNGLSTTVSFEYGHTSSYGQTISAEQSPISGWSDVSVSAQLSELLSDTTYHFRVTATSSVGTSWGDDNTFNTVRNAPVAFTGEATNISDTSATLNGTVNPRGLSTMAIFEYGTSLSYGLTVTADQSPINGLLDISVSAQINDLSPDVTYYYRTKATNNEASTYGDSTSFRTLADRTPLVIYDVSQPVVQLGQDITITANVSDNTQLQSITLMYRKGGDLNFVQKSMELSGGLFTATISSVLNTENGIEYYVSAKDSTNNEVTSEHYFLEIEIPANTLNYQLSGGSSQNAYRMVSVPLDILNGSINNVLVDDLGSYDPKEWRIFKDTNDQYREYPNCGDFSPGYAFWLICRNDAIIDFPAGRTTFAEDIYQIVLQPGWNQIGLPFNFNISWQDILETSGNPNISGPFLYEGFYVSPMPTILEPFKGYYVENRTGSSTSLIFPLHGSGASLSKIKEPEDSWRVQISAYIQNAVDVLNILGASCNSSDLYDSQDLSEPPPIGEYVSLYFPHLDWDDYPGNYAVDIRSVSEQGYVWDFEVKTNIPKSTIKLIFDDFDKFSNSDDDYNIGNFRIVLIDPDARISQDLKSNSHFYFPATIKEFPKSFRLIIGTDSFVEKNNLGIPLMPTQFDLSQNYPNPFNLETFINYQLSGQTKVVMTIYNTLGLKIRFLVDEDQPTGYHRIIWDGKNDEGRQVATGIYFLRLKAGEFIKQIKMILMR
jgi:phosphodiesterase/alkaline phosphatase D-like protein